MKTSLGNKVAVKLFVGFLVNAQLKRKFYASDKWRLAQIAWQSQSNGLEIIPYKGKEYVGKYVEDLSLTTDKIRDSEDKIKTQLIYHCPEIIEKDLKLYIFPQVFVR